MSKVQPRPGAVRRPGAPLTGVTQRKGQSPEELRALPAFADDGVDIDMDPDNASSGKITDETVIITDAKFVTRTFQRKDGTFPDDASPDIALAVFYRREGDDDGDKTYEEKYRYAYAGMFAPTKDGLFVKARKSAMKEGVPAPRPRKTAPGVAFLQSIKNAGGGNVIERVKTEGITALKGLRVHVRLQRVQGSNEKAKDVLLVDYIDGVGVPSAPVPVAAGAQAMPSAPVPVPAATQAVNNVESLAGDALLDILEQAEGNSISRAQIPTTLIRIDKWKSHEHRGAILKLLRDDAFITRSGQAWKVSGNTVSL